jgi:translocation and assembly module TamB
VTEPAAHASGRRFLRCLKWSALLVLPLAGVLLLFGTETGFKLLVRSADTLAGPYFSAEQAEGRLIDRWRLRTVRIQVKNAVDISLDEFSASWNPKALLAEREIHFRSIAARGLSVRLAASSKKQEKKAHKRIVLPEIRLPLGVRIEELHVADSRIVTANGKDAIVFYDALAQAAVRDDRAEITRLKVDSSQFGCDLRGAAQFIGAWPVQASGNWHVPDHGINELVGAVEAQGDFDKVAVTATMTAPAKVVLKGHATDILNDLRWHAAAETGHFRLSDIRVKVPVDGTLRIVEAEGTVKRYRGVLAADAQYEGYPPITAEAKVEAADYTGLKIEHFTVRHKNAELILRGAMRWKGGFSWQAELEGKGLDPAVAVPNLPGNIGGLIRSSGQLSAAGKSLEVIVDGVQGELTRIPFNLSGRLELADKAFSVDKLRLQSGTAQAEINGKATADKTLDFAVQAQADDLAAFAPEAGGSLRLEGSMAGSVDKSALNVTLSGSNLTFQERSLSDLTSKLDAELEHTGLTIKRFQAIAGGKSALNLKGRLNWADGLSWQADVKAAELDPALIAPEWPGAINAELRSQGSKTADKLAAAVDIDRLDGTLRGFPLTGGGKVTLDGKDLALDALHLQSGSTRIQLNGTADAAHDLALVFKANSDNLASLAPEVSGAFDLRAAVSGDPQQPTLSLNASGSKLKIKEYSLNNLNAAVRADLSAASGQMDGEIKAAGLKVNNETISSALLRVKGSAAQHWLDFSAEGSPGAARLAVAGGWKEQQWQGKLNELRIESKQFGRWKAADGTELLLSAARSALSGFSLIHERGLKASLSGAWAQEQGWQAEGKVSNLSIDLLRTWNLPVPPRFDGVVQIEASAQGKGAIPQQAELAVVLPDLALTAEDYEKDGGLTTWHWQDNQIQTRLQDNALHVIAQTRFQDGSTATLQAAADDCGDFSRPEQMPLSGQLAVDIKDLGPLAPLTAYAVQGEGGFGGRIELRGTAARPKLHGTLALQKGGKEKEGSLHLPAAGITLQQLKLAVEGDGSSNQAELRLASGNGTLLAKGTLSRQAGQPLAADFHITGENFQTANLPEYQVAVSPDLRLRSSGNSAALSGTLVVPKAKIAPTGLGGAVSSSKDVVIVDQGNVPEKNSLPVSADVSLILGKEVAVDAFGVKGFVDGGLKISAKPDQTVTASGSLLLRDTSVDFEGVTLQLNEGRIFYQGGPIDNPGLDIRASRRIDEVEAGIHLTGSADDMSVKLFSDTPMEDSEILSWLLSGQDSVSSSKGTAALSPAAAALSKIGGGALLKSVNPLGVAGLEDEIDLSIGGGKEASDVSLVMGKEIYKDLYISYGKDLTKEGGSFKARYDLDYGFSVESETSSTAVGADILWSLER